MSVILLVGIKFDKTFENTFLFGMLRFYFHHSKIAKNDTQVLCGNTDKIHEY